MSSPEGIELPSNLLKEDGLLLQPLPAALKIENYADLTTLAEEGETYSNYQQKYRMTKEGKQQREPSGMDGQGYASNPKQRVEDSFVLVIEGSDAETGRLMRPAVANDEYHFRVRTFQPLISSEDKEANEYYQSFLQRPSQRRLLNTELLDKAK